MIHPFSELLRSRKSRDMEYVLWAGVSDLLALSRSPTCCRNTLHYWSQCLLYLTCQWVVFFSGNLMPNGFCGNTLNRWIPKLEPASYTMVKVASVEYLSFVVVIYVVITMVLCFIEADFEGSPVLLIGVVASDMGFVHNTSFGDGRGFCCCCYCRLLYLVVAH